MSGREMHFGDKTNEKLSGSIDFLA